MRWSDQPSNRINRFINHMNYDDTKSHMYSHVHEVGGRTMDHHFLLLIAYVARTHLFSVIILWNKFHYYPHPHVVSGKGQKRKKRCNSLHTQYRPDVGSVRAWCLINTYRMNWLVTYCSTANNVNYYANFAVKQDLFDPNFCTQHQLFTFGFANMIDLYGTRGWLSKDRFGYYHRVSLDNWLT